MNEYKKNDYEVATLGGGCFWCIQAVFGRLHGVLSVVSGYSGGSVDDPTYRAVCSGVTGHAEVVQIKYDPSKISYTDILNFFFKAHDPTTLNRQGADIGTQYRSIILYHDLNQKRIAEHIKRELNRSHNFSRPVVTEIKAFSEFYPAEAFHQDYYKKNRYAGYCMAVIVPKLKKLNLELVHSR